MVQLEKVRPFDYAITWTANPFEERYSTYTTHTCT